MCNLVVCMFKTLQKFAFKGIKELYKYKTKAFLVQERKQLRNRILHCFKCTYIKITYRDKLRGNAKAFTFQTSKNKPDISSLQHLKSKDWKYLFSALYSYYWKDVIFVIHTAYYAKWYASAKRLGSFLREIYVKPSKVENLVS